MNRSPRTMLAAAFCTFGWLSSFSYPLHLIGPHAHTCTGGDASPYLVSMIAGPATLGMAAMLLAMGAGLGVAARWPALLHVGTLAAAVLLLPDYLVNTTIEGQFLCASNAAGGPHGFETTPWQRAFVPIHNAAMILFGGFCVWYWRRCGRSSRALAEPTRAAAVLALTLALVSGSAEEVAGDGTAPDATPATSCLERPVVVVYLHRLQDRIMEYWVVPDDSLTDQVVVVRFRLAADGSFIRTELLFSTSTHIVNGVELALRHAGPFGPVPESADCIVGRPIEMRFENPS